MSRDDLCCQKSRYAFSRGCCRRHTDHCVPTTRQSNSRRGPYPGSRPLNLDRLLARARARGTETSVIPSDDAHYHPLTSAGYSPVVPDNDLAGRHQQTGCARMFLSLNHFRNPYKNIKAGKIIVVQSQETFSAMDLRELVPSP